MAAGPAAGSAIETGQTVALFPLTACGHCYPCRIGRPNVCVNFSLIGVHEDGGLQERLRITEKTRSSRSTARAPWSPRSSSRCRSRCAPCTAGGSPTEKVVVLGAGPIGQSLLVAAQDRGARMLLVIDPIEDRLETARALGAETVPWTTAKLRSVARRGSGAATTGRRS